MKIIAGLGNPGEKYDGTRHNAGFMVVREIAGKHGISIKKRAYGGVYGFGKILGQELLIFEPHTYMNLSGEAINAICSRHLEKKEDLLVVSDDVVLALGVLRLREKGSSGGHNGLSSIISYLGADFARLRVGVGMEKAVPDMKDYVLSNFRSEEQPILKEVISRAVLCAEEWLVSGAKKAMGIYNDSKADGKAPREGL